MSTNTLNGLYLGASEEEIDELLSGDEYEISGEGDLIGAVAPTFKKKPLNTVKRLAMLRGKGGSVTAQAVNRLRTAARATLSQTAAIEAWLQRMPNNIAGIVEPVAAATSFSFTITPAPSQNAYEVMWILSTDVTIGAFGLSVLTIGGLPHIAVTNNGTTANFAGMSLFSTRDPKAYGLQPWAGRVFGANSTIVGTCRNFSAATAVFVLDMGIRSSACPEYQGVEATRNARALGRAVGALSF
jgi:hypothetical protein